MTFRTPQLMGASGCAVGSRLRFMFPSELHFTVAPRQRPQMLKSFETVAHRDVWRLWIMFLTEVCGRTAWWDWSLVKVRVSDLNFTPEISFALNVSFVFYQCLGKYGNIIAWPVVVYCWILHMSGAHRIHYTSLCVICLWSRPYHFGGEMREK